MIEVLYTGFPVKFSDKLWLSYLNCLPKDFRDINQKYRRWEDQHANLLGKLLLLLGLRKYGFGKEMLPQLRYTAHNRPFLAKKIDFNISHSGHYVLCAIGSDIRIGVDIEEVKAIDFDDFETVMNYEQWEEIRGAGDPTKKFYDYWTIKESIIKADGRGVSIPLKDLAWKDGAAVYEDSTWNIQSIPIDDRYTSHLATSVSGLPVKLKKIDFYDDKYLPFLRQ